MAGQSDARNVNNWHWVEKNATPWSKRRFEELLIGQTVEKGAIKVTLNEFKKLEGDATANNRKAKLIFLYEFEILIKFTANVSGSDLIYNGVLEIPNLSDENQADEIDVNITIETLGPHKDELYHILNTDGKTFIQKQIGVYIRELKEEFSKGLILSTAKPQVMEKAGGKTAIFDKRSFQNEVVTDKSADNQKAEKIEVTNFEITESFKVPPRRLYEILTEPELIKAWSGGSAEVETKEGGKFTLFGGQIAGSFTKLKEEEIEVEWRLRSYPTNHYAHLDFLLVDKNDSTDLILKATNVPRREAANTEEGLRRHYFANIGRVFGCALRMF
ncbi:Activator of Hsp90 ATPase [Aphelenchoides besseyi]|nr:Activator of Hsp90 ATPase [Aphelenchoides besseyi]